MQFTDDTILLGGASQIIARRFKTELDRYCRASGSEISFRKSHIYGWNINPREMLDISRILNMNGVVDWEYFNYLGIPIFKAKPKSSAWNPIIEKIKRKIHGWGSIWLNLAGKVVLIKAVLNSCLLYQSSLLLAPATVISQIEGLIRSFLWQNGNAGGGKKFALVSWKIIKLHRPEGGLSIRDLRSQKLAMGAKLLWNLIAPKPSWCSKVLKAKYFSGLRLRCLDGAHVNQKGSSIYNICLKALPQFKDELYWVPGNGKSINLWHDKILGKTPPQTPRL